MKVLDAGVNSELVDLLKKASSQIVQVVLINAMAKTVKQEDIGASLGFIVERLVTFVEDQADLGENSLLRISFLATMMKFMKDSGIEIKELTEYLPKNASLN